MRLVIIVTLSLVSAQAFKLDGGDGDKVCTLEKSATNGENCFYEPECQNVCKDVQSTVSWIRVWIQLFLLLSCLGVSRCRGGAVQAGAYQGVQCAAGGEVQDCVGDRD